MEDFYGPFQMRTSNYPELGDEWVIYVCSDAGDMELPGVHSAQEAKRTCTVLNSMLRTWVQRFATDTVLELAREL